MFYWIVKGIFYPAVKIYFRFSVSGLRHIPKKGPLLVVANHTSFLDPFLLGSAFPRQIHFLVRQDMYDWMRLCWFYVGMDTIPVRRVSADPKAIRRALQTLGRGRVVGIFPEGSRSQDGQLGGGKLGSSFLAAKSGAPVLPVSIAGAHLAMPAGRRFPRPATVRVTFGDPLAFPPPTRKRISRTDLEVFSQTLQGAIGALLVGNEPARPEEEAGE